MAVSFHGFFQLSCHVFDPPGPTRAASNGAGQWTLVRGTTNRSLGSGSRHRREGRASIDGPTRSRLLLARGPSPTAGGDHDAIRERSPRHQIGLGGLGALLTNASAERAIPRAIRVALDQEDPIQITLEPDGMRVEDLGIARPNPGRPRGKVDGWEEIIRDRFAGRLDGCARVYRRRRGCGRRDLSGGGGTRKGGSERQHGKDGQPSEGPASESGRGPRVADQRRHDQRAVDAVDRARIEAWVLPGRLHRDRPREIGCGGSRLATPGHRPARS
jgi:hypothetical protein